jgi:hypothetical protein
MGVVPTLDGVLPGVTATLPLESGVNRGGPDPIGVCLFADEGWYAGVRLADPVPPIFMGVLISGGRVGEALGLPLSYGPCCGEGL